MSNVRRSARAPHLVIKMPGHLLYLAHCVVHETAAFAPVMQRQPLPGLVLADERRRLHPRIREFKVLVQIVQTYGSRTIGVTDGGSCRNENGNSPHRKRENVTGSRVLQRPRVDHGFPPKQFSIAALSGLVYRVSLRARKTMERTQWWAALRITHQLSEQFHLKVSLS